MSVVDSKPQSGLAIDGGQPVRTRPLPPWPEYGEEEVAAVGGVLRSGQVNYWTGREGVGFESEFAAYLGRRHALTLANGTVALQLGLRALGIGPGDEVIVTPRSFFASVSTIVQCGARPVFVDVDADSQNIVARTIAPAITDRTRALMLVHHAGWPCDMGPITELAHSHGLRIIEDCAQAHGARYGNQPVGSFGDVAAFSFCQDKIMSTGGEGGMLVMDDADLWNAAWAYRDHGKSRAAVFDSPHPIGFRWLHESIGTNWRMTELQSVIGRRQLAKLDGWVDRRRRLAARLSRRLSEVAALRLTIPGPEAHHSYYKYYCFIRPERLRENWSRDRIMQALQAEGVPGMSGSCPEIYLEKALTDAGIVTDRLPIAKALGETSLMFPVHPTLDEGDVDDCCRALEKVLAAACH